ncbi:MAG: LytTR family DNA-binding domain-containing protein [Prevotellaceae bacterium]|nr:LytTR family DNA-binding domain-containing protein [Prevotellaceae bacterium]MDO4932864.1 LytTR family DNA-binding domain-containing protein [Prevotellaceae bacterium]
MSDLIKCVAIDDEPLALEVIDKFCQRLGSIELKKFSNPAIGLEAIGQSRPDIVFLDIEMDGINGLDIASRLPKDTCFIFTTAYLRYAVNGFDLDAVDYLHKPFAYSRFQIAFSKAMRRIGREQIQTAPQSIVVKQEYNNISIPLDDILYIEAIEAYSRIFRLTGKCVTSRILLKNIYTMLSPELFLRIHRSFVVSKSKIKSFTKQEVILNNGKALPVGRQYASELFAILIH